LARTLMAASAGIPAAEPRAYACASLRARIDADRARVEQAGRTEPFEAHECKARVTEEIEHVPREDGLNASAERASLDRECLRGGDGEIAACRILGVQSEQRENEGAAPDAAHRLVRRGERGSRQPQRVRRGWTGNGIAPETSRILQVENRVHEPAARDVV